MKRSYKKCLVSVFFLLLFAVSSLPAYGAEAQETMKHRSQESGLHFREDGTFKILLIADTQDTHRTQSDTILFIEKALEQEQPDLVVFLGDIVAGFGAWGIYPYINGANDKNVYKAIDRLVGPVEKAGIPFAVVFGNHDAEEGVGVSKELQFHMYQTYSHCLSYQADGVTTGYGTYNLLVKDRTGRKNMLNLYFFDSGMYQTSMQDGEYANLGEDQLAWYQKTSVALAKSNGGTPLPSLAFQHVIVPEFYNTLKAVDPGTAGAVKGYKGFSDRYWTLDERYSAGERSLRDYTRPQLGKGRLLEAPASPSQSNGEFQLWKEQGDIMAGFFGHDHKNEAVTRLDGIDLAYVPSCGFFMYGNGAEAAMRTVELRESERKGYQTRLIFFKDIVGRDPVNLTNAPYNGNLTTCLFSVIGFLLSVLFLSILIVYECFSHIKKARRKSVKIK